MSKYLELNTKQIAKNIPFTRSYVLLKSIILATQNENQKQFKNLQNFVDYTIRRQGFLIDIAVTSKPLWPLQLETNTNINMLANIIKQQQGEVKLSYHLKDGLWLNYSEAIIIKTMNAILLFFVVAIGVLFMILLYLFSMRRLREPLSNITSSANRLGLDINAKPLRAYGPAIVPNSGPFLPPTSIFPDQIFTN